MSGIGSRSAPTYDTGAPAGYVAGIGRGALGFTTRSDIGPARAAAALVTPSGAPGAMDPSFGPAPAGYVAGRGRGMGELAKTQSEVPAGDGDRGDYSESNYDEFAGYGERLFSAGVYEEDDAEADQIYGTVDEAMESRRKRVRERQLLLEQKKAKTERPRIADQFADLKRDLAKVTADEWESIPDVGDHSLKYKQSRKRETATAVPDSLLASAARLSGQEMGTSIDPRLDPTSGYASSLGSRSVAVGLSEVRGSELSSRLDKMSDSFGGQTVVDPKGYITSLDSLKINSSAEIGDIKKARVLLQSVTTTNPKHGPGWIAAARVEEFANKMTQARKIILQGCEKCPESEDVWLEAARLHPVDTGKAILANAVIQIPTSVKIWLKAADMETSENKKKAVLRRSLEYIPNSVQLWKAAIELENITDARIMLARAVECVPQSVEMWLALAKLETHENARKVLNKAREAIPTERTTWITASKLEEAHGNGHLVGRIVEKMVVSLAQFQVVIKREEWIQEAIECERSGAVLTGNAIIRNTITQGVDAEDRKKTWMDDAETCLCGQSPPAVQTARSILKYALEVFPSKRSLWQQLAMLEKDHGTSESLETTLKEGVKHCPHAEILWLMAAKEKWLQDRVPDARAILLEGFQANPKSEQIWLAAVKLEWENSEFQRARLLLSRARERAPSERVFLKSALLEREMKDFPQVLRLLDEGIQLYPRFFKFYLMAAQCSEEELKDNLKARNYLMAGLKVVPDHTALWRQLMQLEERVKGVLKARSTAELARVKLPKNEEIWLESVRLERRARNDKLADNLMAKALQDCPKSGLLWAEVLLTCTKNQQRSKAIDALKKCDQDPLVILAVARLFEQAQRVAKARKWYSRVLTMEPKLGDAHVYLFALEYVQTYKEQLLAEGVHLKQEEAVGAKAVEGGGTEMDGIDDDEEDLNIPPIETSEKAEAEMSSSAPTESANAASASGGLDIATAEKAARLHHLLEKCAQAQPNSGELWCAVSKETTLRRQPVGLILLECVERVLGFPLYSSLKEKAATLPRL